MFSFLVCALFFVMFGGENDVNCVENYRGQRDTLNKYSTFKCIGGSQVFKSESMIQASVKVFPLNDPEYRTCLYTNVCFINGAFTFYVNNASSTPKDYTPEGFSGGNVNHLSYLRGFTMPVHTTVGGVPLGYNYSPVNLTFLDANSWSFNYGHYINDNVLPTYYASRLFDLDFNNVQQLFETNCRLFSTLEEGFSKRVITYNHSMGTYRKGCLDKIDGMYHHFYNHRPLYVDDLMTSNMCFRQLVTGQGSAYGLKAIDLGKAVLLREFRNYVLQRLITRPTGEKVVIPPQENLILVGMRTVGAAGGDIIHDLCSQVKTALNKLEQYKDHYTVKCIVPSDLSFEHEILEAQRAKVIVTVHGTISYLSYFTRDGTQTISLSNPKELKENQNLLYATHFNAVYLNWDRVGAELSGVVENALHMSEDFHYAGMH
jgi:hypothetical protein